MGEQSGAGPRDAVEVYRKSRKIILPEEQNLRFGSISHVSESAGVTTSAEITIDGSVVGDG